MALTKEQKQLLDNAIIDAITTKVKENGQTIFQAYSLYEMIRDNLNFCISNPVCSIDYAIIRIRKTSFPIMDNYNHSYIYNDKAIVIDGNITTFKKDKNKIFFDCHSDLSYDFETKTLNIDFKNIFLKNNNWNCIFNYEDIFNKMMAYEWLFNYTSDLSIIADIIQNCPIKAYEKMPKGFFEVLKENNNQINNELLSDYYYKSTYGKYYRLAEQLNSCNNNELLDYFISFYSMDFLFSMIKNSIINGNFESKYDINNFLSMFKKVKNQCPEAALDKNRDIEYNLEILEDIFDREKNAILAKKLQRLNFINNYSNDEYIIIVPQSQKDKQDEGKMQHNCVGSFYDSSIIEDRDLIYFIRKKANPKKSYITCRFNVQSWDTVEYRTINNNRVTDDNALAFMNEVTQIIKDNLKI